MPPRALYMARLARNFDFNFSKGLSKKISYIWAPRLWAGRRKEPILGYMSRKTTKKEFRQSKVGEKLIQNDYNFKYLIPM